jgi:hypothetical protein
MVESGNDAVERRERAERREKMEDWLERWLRLRETPRTRCQCARVWWVEGRGARWGGENGRCVSPPHSNTSRFAVEPTAAAVIGDA